jgi:signal transduction histidine kinase
MRLVPRTLGMQLVGVTAAAVLLSNIAVATWFELTSARQSEAELMERVVDRAASAAALLAAIPQKSRDAASDTMSTGVWNFDIHDGKDVGQPMTPEEAQIATKVRALLPKGNASYPVSVSIREKVSPPAELRAGRRTPGPAIQFIVPITANEQVIATFYRAPNTSWPVEILAAALGAIIAASAAAAYFARRVTRPLSDLARAASVVARGGAAPRLNETGPQDVRDAAHAFNAMTDEVSRTLEGQRQLLSAVGHDLRTPITAMRISIEFVEDAELRERLQKNLEELQDLTEAVLSAARGTGGELKRNVDLSALLESICADLDDLGEPVSCNIHDEAAPLVCRPNEIRRAVRNLVENAVAYGGRASVQLAKQDGSYEIVVEDEGPGIPEADQTRVFEPFVRLESSRNEETGGTGLGLTLVKAIAEGHGGAVTLENRSEGGLRARLRLPREAAAA